MKPRQITVAGLRAKSTSQNFSVGSEFILQRDSHSITHLTDSVADFTSVENEYLLDTHLRVARDEIESEREAHRKTRLSAQLRMLELEARLARRNAELEACVVHDHILGGDLGDSDTVHAPMSNSEAVQILQVAEARNISLERDVHQLMNRVSAQAVGDMLSLQVNCFQARECQTSSRPDRN